MSPENVALAERPIAAQPPRPRITNVADMEQFGAFAQHGRVQPAGAPTHPERQPQEVQRKTLLETILPFASPKKGGRK